MKVYFNCFSLARPTRNLFACFCALLPLFGISQNSDDRPSRKKISGGLGFFATSLEQNQMTELNNTIAKSGYGSVPDMALAIGGGGLFAYNHFIFGGGGNWLIDEQTQNVNNNLTLEGGYGYFNFGYIAFSRKNSVFYPALGFGGGGYTLTLSKKTPSGDFTQQLGSPTSMLTAKTGGWMLNIQMNYQLFLSKEGRDGFCIGLKAGYKYCPGNWKMTINNNPLANSPGINMNGFFATLTLGGGALHY